eukprot:6204197-Pleurochrysis_carterae.AAC.2
MYNAAVALSRACDMLYFHRDHYLQGSLLLLIRTCTSRLLWGHCKAGIHDPVAVNLKLFLFFSPLALSITLAPSPS